MPDVAFKDLCIDVTEGADRPARVAAFWSVALDQAVVAHDDGSFHLAPPPATPSGAQKSRTVWINVVPEAMETKSRVHLDVRVAHGDPAPLLAAGGTLERAADAHEGGDLRWHVLHDPDGVALCVFPPHPAAPTALGPFELVVDSNDHERIAQWWADRTGGTIGRTEGAPFVWIENAAGFPFVYWVFHDVPEPKRLKNRVHWDVTLLDASIDSLVAVGARLLRSPDHRVDGDIDWWVLADPDGNEFCAFTRPNEGE